MRRLLPALCLCLLTPALATAQPQLSVSTSEVPSGGAITVTVTGTPGLYWALVGSFRDNGLVYGGTALAVGTDVQILGTGFFDPSGTVNVPFVPPLANGVDEYFLQAVSSAAPNFIPLTASAGIAVRPRGLYTNTPTFTAGLNAGGARVTGVGAPVAASDAANKSYVDLTAAILGPGAKQSKASGSAIIDVEQTGSGDLLSLRTNSSSVPGAGGSPINAQQFRFMADGGFLAKGAIGYGLIPASGAGWRMMWYPYKVAFRAGYADAGGQFDDAKIGFYSWAGGALSAAPGNYAFAMGNQNLAEAQCATAIGSGNKVYGNATDGFATCGVALGLNNEVRDQAGVALGQSNDSDGDAAVALGYTAVANADYSMAFGYRPSTNGHTGAKVFSDASTTDPFLAGANNEFAVRAAGGYRFRTNATTTSGCNLPAGSGVFTCSSDRNLKEAFAPVDGEDVLAKLAAMPIQRWSYKSEPGVAHVGPVAQDFYAAFGLGTDDVTIGHLDETGIALRAVQALEARTRALSDANARLAGENATLKAALDALAAEVAALKATPR